MASETLIERLRNGMEGWSYDVNLVPAEVAEEAADRIASLEAEVAALREVLGRCRAQFAFYVASHRAKSPPDNEKADTNLGFVEIIDGALLNRGDGNG